MSILFMIGMVGLIVLGFASLLWFVSRKRVDQPTYQPEGKIRWSDQEQDA